MESLQRQRAQNWGRRMDDMSLKRQRLGLLLQDALFRLEKITGVFLIKPFISYQGKTRLRKYELYVLCLLHQQAKRIYCTFSGIPAK